MALRLTRALRFTASTLPKAKPTTAPITRATHPNSKKTTTTTTLEVERKFRRLTLPTLTITTPDPNTNPNQQPNFQSVLALPTRQIHDIYYDTPAHTLCAAGAWIRKRNGKWEAKINNRAAWGGDFVNSRFEEVCGAEAVAGCVEGILGRGRGAAFVAGEDDNFGLETLAEFVTTREGWLVDGEFKVVRDRMDFGHEVGEVELQVEVGGGRDGEVMGEEEKGVVMEEMDQRIERFMQRYAWAWERGDAVGKLTAYFEMVKRRGGRGL